MKNGFIHFLKKLKNGFLQFLKKFKHFNYAFVPLIISVIFIIAINSQMTSIMNMGRFANRYIMIIYPLFAAFAVSFVILYNQMDFQKQENMLCNMYGSFCFIYCA